jgi:hypothetical protein
MTDWITDVKRYAPDADAHAVESIVSYCGPALHSRDSALVAFSSKAELKTVRESFLKRKLGLTNPDSELDAAIAAVGERMKSVKNKNRVTVYYLLAEHFGKIPAFA